MHGCVRFGLLAGLLCSNFIGLGVADAAPRYPDNFLWGVAFSAHQTEGSTGGGEAGDWWLYEHPAPGKASPIANGDTADLAVDHWNRYPEDIRIAKSLGVNTVRTSIAWEKLEPAPGVFSTEAIAHYRQVLQTMRAQGLRPMIALHHFTHPQWFHDRGGWLSADSPAVFARYAKRVVSELGDLCELWITFNEPMVLVTMGYLKGEIPPLQASLDSAYEAAYQIARAHRMAAAAIHDAQGPGGIGLANSFQLYDPFDPGNPMDVRAADTLADLNNWAFVRGVLAQEMEFTIPEEVPSSHSFRREYPATDLLPWQVHPSLDWVGVNYYARYLIRYEPTSPLRASWITPEGPVSDNGWAIYPAGLERILRQTAERFPLPLMVSENGLSDSSDSKRPGFIHEHLAAMDHAVFGSEQGPALDVRGYYHWSLMDNFEWLSGYQYRFGLVEIDYRDGLKRVPRPSARIYADEIARRRAGAP